MRKYYIKERWRAVSDFQQFVPSKVCLTCDGCCRFKEADSAWRPKVTKQDISEIRREGLAEKIFRQALKPDGRLATRCHLGENLCSFFNALDHTCGIYSARPFECQLYPFLLNRKSGRIVLSVHLLCPYIQETKPTQIYQEYVEYLRGYFARPEVLNVLRADPAIADDYSDHAGELEDVFIVDPGQK